MKAFFKYYWEKLEFWRKLIVKSCLRFNNDGVFHMSAALAYYTMFSLPPIINIIIFIASFFFDGPSVEHNIFTELANIIGHEGANQLHNIINNMRLFKYSTLATILSIVVAIFTATTVFITVENSLNIIFRVNYKSNYQWLQLIKTRLISFLLIIGIAFLLIVFLVMNPIFSFINHLLLQASPELSFWFVKFIAWILPIIVMTLLFTMIFRYLPKTTVKWTKAFRGGIISAILFELGKYFISLYIGESDIANVYDAAGSFMVLLIWVYYTAVVFFFGAEITYVYNELTTREEHKKPFRRPPHEEQNNTTVYD